MYYDPKTGYTGINDLVRKSGEKQQQVIDFLNKQDTYTLHKPVRHTFKTRRVYVQGIDDQWQADLVEMREFALENKGYNYLLTVIDCFSKYAWAHPIKSKSSQNIIDAFTRIFSERCPKKLQTDKGKEFINKHFQKYLRDHTVKWFSTDSAQKASIVERFNRTLKTKMWRLFTEKGVRKWIDILNKLILNYNNTHHRSIKMTPTEASKIKNESTVYGNLYPLNNLNELSTHKYQDGDKVRISKYKQTFAKGYLPNWTTELFIVNKVLNTQPITYKIKDLNGEEITGIFYEPELVKFDKPDDDYQVEKILKTRTSRGAKAIKGKKEYFIKWQGYGPEFNSWIPAENLKN